MSFVGSTLDPQSEFEGGTSIHSSRWGFLEASSAAACVTRSICSRSACLAAVEPAAGGREGPKSSSESEESGPVGEGGVEGRSERGAGGRAGPITRRRLEVEEEVEELRDWGEGPGGGEGDEERLRFVRWGGSVGPTVGIARDRL